MDRRGGEKNSMSVNTVNNNVALRLHVFVRYLKIIKVFLESNVCILQKIAQGTQK